MLRCCFGLVGGQDRCGFLENERILRVIYAKQHEKIDSLRPRDV
jgi:hypothetical protein